MSVIIDRPSGKGRSTLGQVRGNPPVEHPTLMDVAWAAGIYEGEGSVFFHSASQNIVVEVSQVGDNGWLPGRLKALFGGHTAEKKRRDEYAHRIAYRWVLSGARARGFLMTMYSFLSPRRKERVRRALTLGVIE